MHKGTKRLSRYELREHLGHGGVAEVWKAFDLQTHHYVAVKVFDADLQNSSAFLKRFTQEAEIITALDHPNIARTHGFKVSRPPETENTVAYLVSDYIEGPTLVDYIHITARSGQFPPPEDIIFLFTTIGEAVDYVHGHGLTHHAINPANIRLDENNTSRHSMGEPMLTDVGIDRLLKRTTGIHSNKPQYLSPEHAQNLPGDERSDIYSLGVILYELYTGVDIYEGTTAAAITRQHIHGTPRMPSSINPNIPPAVEAVILRSLEKDPAKRFVTASELAEALVTAINTTDVEVVDAISESPEIVNGVAKASPAFGMIDVSDEQVKAANVIAGNGSHTLDDPTVIALPPTRNSLRTAQPPATTPPSPPTSVPPAPPTPVSPDASSSRRRRHWRDAIYIGIIVLLLLALLLCALLPRPFPQPPPVVSVTPTFPATTVPTTAPTPGGHVFFLSSGQINESNSQGIGDQLQVELQNIPNPAPGKSYYAWFLPDSDSAGKPLLLGKLTVKNGSAELIYPGDANHTNLFAIGSRLVVSEDDAHNPPARPNPSTWRFYDAISQNVSASDNLSLLNHLRYLLSGDPTLDKLGLPGGLNIWFYRNAAKVAEWASSARDDWQGKNAPYIHHHMVRILDYLDGISLVQQDVPPGTPIYVNPHDGQVPLLEIDSPSQQPPGFFHLVALRLNGVLQSPNVSVDQVRLIALIMQALDHAKTCLNQVRSDAKQLVTLNNDQLLQPSSLVLLNDMFTQAYCAFAGQSDPSNVTAVGGVSVIYNVIQYLGTFNVTPYKKR